MYKVLNQKLPPPLCTIAKLFLIMKLTTLILITAILQVSATAFAQKVTLSERNSSMIEVMDHIRVQTGYDFLYGSVNVKNLKNITIELKNLDLRDALTLILEPQHLDFSIVDRSVVIKPKSALPIGKPIRTPLKGRIVDKDGKPIPGVTVRIVGTRLITITNDNGEYYFAGVPEGKCTIEISCIGFGNVQKPVDVEPGMNATMGEITMEGVSATLNEAIVVGYGTSDKRSLIGSISKLKPNAAGAAPLSIDQMMSGRMAGVNITSSNGAPGSAVAITIRGLSTMNNRGNSPLIVIDGIPVYGMGEDGNKIGKMRAVPGGSPGGSSGSGASAPVNFEPTGEFEKNPLTALNPDDIESVEVLKDAYSTAIYGSRGAAGVILITTKRGAPGSPRINAQINTSSSRPFGRYHLMTGDQYADFYNAYLKAFDSSDTRQFPKGISTDWQSLIMRQPIGLGADVNISGGSDKNAYYVSMGYDNQPSYIINNGYRRYHGKISIDQQLNKHLKLGANVMLSNENNSALSAQELFREAVLKAPNVEVYLPDGSYNWSFEPNPTGNPFNDLNPVAKAKRNIRYATDTRILGKVFAELKLTPWLTAKSEFGTDWANRRMYSREKSSPRALPGYATEMQSQNQKWVINNLITFNKRFGSFHRLTIVAGQSFESSTENSLGVYGEGFNNDDILSPFAASIKTVPIALQQRTNLLSVFGRADYQFKNRYLAGLTYRVDGSSRFSKNHRYVGFPSASLGWIVNEEYFMEDVKWIDQLKLRASFGYTGTDRSAGYYGNQGQYKYGVSDRGDITYGNMRTLTVSQANNPNLKWERLRTIDLGLDLSLWKNLVALTFDYYNKRTKDAVLSVALPQYMGFETQDLNLAEVSNKGWELAVTIKNINTKNFQWTSSFNISGNRNKIVSINTNDPEGTALSIERQLRAGEINSNNNYWIPGYSTTTFFMYEWAGVDQNTGNPLWIDKDGKLTDVPIMTKTGGQIHRKPMGDAAPKVYGGISNSFSYKKFDLDFTFGYALGHKMYNGSKAKLYTYTDKIGPYDNANNLSPELLNYWREKGQLTQIPKIINNSILLNNDYSLSRESSRFLEDASFIKLRNVTLGYNLNPSSRFLKALRIYSGKVFVQLENVFVLTKYSGIDPEVNAYGSSGLKAGNDELTMPGMRSFRVGLKFGL